MSSDHAGPYEVQAVVYEPPRAAEPVERSEFLKMTCRWEVAFAGAVLLVVSGHLLIKAGLNIIAPSIAGAHLPAMLLAILQQPMVLWGLGIYGMGTLCWMSAVAQTDISMLYPLSCVNYVLIAGFSTYLFHESISPRRAAGTLVIVLGVVLLARSQRKQKEAS